MDNRKKTGFRGLFMVAVSVLFIIGFLLQTRTYVYAANDFSGVVQTGATTGSVDVTFNSSSSYNRFTALVATSKNGNYAETGEITAFNKITVSNLLAGSTYYVKIAGCDEEGELIGNESSPVAVVTAPAGAPSYVIQTGSGAESVTVSWAPITGATGYYVECSLADGTSGAKERLDVNSTTATITGILSSKTYTVTVCPYRSNGSFTAYDAGNAAVLNNVAIRSDSVSGKPTGTVTGLKQTAAGTDNVQIEFNTIGDENARYAVFMSEKKDSGFTAYDRTADSPYVIDKLEPGKTYYIKIAPCYLSYSSLNDTYIANYGDYSDVCEIVTAPGAASASLKQTSIKKKAMTLTWSSVKGATGYIVEYYESGVSDSKKTKNVEKNTVTLKKLKEGSAYTVYVTAYRKGSNGYIAKDDTAYIYKSNLPLMPGKCSKPSVDSIYKSLKKITISTPAVANAEGYEFQLWNEKKKISSATGKSHSSCVIKDDIIAKAGTAKLKVRVRAYISVGGKKIYGKWSDFTPVQ